MEKKQKPAEIRLYGYLVNTRVSGTTINNINTKGTNKMARLVSYKARDENRYSTFGGETSCNSRENLTVGNRILLLPKSNKKSKAKTKKRAKNTDKMPETMPTISSSIEMHRNKIAQSRPINASSDSSGISQERRRRLPLHQQQHLFGTQSRFNCCFNSKFCTQKCNWRCNQSNGCCTIANCWRTIFCCCWWKWCCRRKCCARICCDCIDYEDNENDNGDDDDIDAKFEQYKHEIRQNEFKRECYDTVNDEQETNFQSNSYRIEALPSNTTNIDHETSTTRNESTTVNDGITNGRTSSLSKTTSKIFRYRKYWNWNDSLRSNSDKFLDTLEYDMTDGEQSLQRTNKKNNRTDVSARIKGYIPRLFLTIYTSIFMSLALHHVCAISGRERVCDCTHSRMRQNVLTRLKTFSLYFLSHLFLPLYDTCIFTWRRLPVIFLFSFTSALDTFFNRFFRCICDRC